MRLQAPDVNDEPYCPLFFILPLVETAQVARSINE